MAPGKKGPLKMKALQREVGQLAKRLGLDARYEVPLTRSILNKKPRKLKVVLTRMVDGGQVYRRLAVECVTQDESGTADAKCPGKFDEQPLLPIRGILVYSGPKMDAVSGYLSTMGGIHIDELEPWLQLYFDLPLTGGKSST